jgi:hypothetical protein
MVTNKIFLNKRGEGEEFISLYLIAMIFVVAGGLAGMVFIFAGSPYDVREIEVTLLIDKIADCVSYGGRINESFILNKEVQKTNLDNCHLNFGDEEEEFFYKIIFYEVGDLENSFMEIRGGNLNFESSCEVQGENEFSILPKCVENSFYSLDNLDNQYIIKILTAVRKIEKNVKK